MNDTSPEMEKMVAERYKLMTPDRRMRIASSMFETARAIISAVRQRQHSRCHLNRMYGGAGGRRA